jgi:histidinol-phosphate/aromatic aminotransferase/cobyric acid decarboxylase-like protein
MRIPVFEMERMQSTWENLVEFDMSESGVRPVSLHELAGMGLDLDALMNMPLGYSQSNGTIALREELAMQYPGATVDHIEVTNGTSEANYLLALALLRDGDEVAFEVPNYMQYGGVPVSVGA